jgi:hypothetical protein
MSIRYQFSPSVNSGCKCLNGAKCRIKDDGITACCLLSDTAQGDHTPVDVPYENVYTIGYIPFKVIEKGVAHGGVVIVGIHPEPYAIWRQLGHFIVAVRCLGDNLVGC